jgi:hypothetical protein
MGTRKTSQTARERCALDRGAELRIAPFQQAEKPALYIATKHWPELLARQADEDTVLSVVGWDDASRRFLCEIPMQTLVWQALEISIDQGRCSAPHDVGLRTDKLRDRRITTVCADDKVRPDARLLAIAIAKTRADDPAARVGLEMGQQDAMMHLGTGNFRCINKDTIENGSPGRV